MVVAGLAVLVLAVPVPIARFIPELEARASERLGEPVRIASLRLSLLPLPHLVATGITVGSIPQAEVGRVVVRPSILALFSDTIVVRELRLERVLVQQPLLLRLAATRESGAEPPRARIERVVIEDATLQLSGATIRDVDAEVLLAADGRPQQIRVSTNGGRLNVSARPDANGALMLDIAARAWRPPAGPPILFDKIDGKALLTRHGIESRDLRASLYGGRASGPVRVSWAPVWAIQGELSVKDVNVQPLVALFVREHVLSGRIDAAPRFSLRARRVRDLLASMELASDFTINDGLLYKIDLVAAAKSPFTGKPRDPDQVAQTRFDELAGHLTVDPDGYYLSGLQVASGLLRAKGELSIAPDRTLDGQIDAEVRGTASLLTVPLDVSGNLSTPVVQPTKTAVAAAVAGSVLLPGIGTAIGLKVSQLTQKLFAGRKKREPAGN